MEETGAKIVCEDPRLSMPCMGKKYQAIDLKRCNRDVPQVDMQELNFVLDLAAAAMDVEKAEAKTAGERKIKWAFLARGSGVPVTPSVAPGPDSPLPTFPYGPSGSGICGGGDEGMYRDGTPPAVYSRVHSYKTNWFYKQVSLSPMGPLGPGEKEVSCVWGCVF